MRNRILARFADSIPYVKQLRPIAKSAVGCLVMQQLDYWFDKHPKGFYKFLSPCPTPACKPGDTWTEELGVSSDEFRTAFDKIGIRYKSKTAFQSAATEGRQFLAQNKAGQDDEYFYCSYTDKSSGKTFYLRNHALIDAALDGLAGTLPPIHVNGDPPFTEMGDPDSRELAIPIHINKVSEITAETTTQGGRQPKPRRKDVFGTPPDICLEVFPADREWLKANAPNVPDPKVATEQWNRKQITLATGGKGKTIEQWRASWESYMITWSLRQANGNGFNGNGNGAAPVPAQKKTILEQLQEEGVEVSYRI